MGSAAAFAASRLLVVVFVVLVVVARALASEAEPNSQTIDRSIERYVLQSACLLCDFIV